MQKGGTPEKVEISQNSEDILAVNTTNIIADEFVQSIVGEDLKDSFSKPNERQFNNVPTRDYVQTLTEEENGTMTGADAFNENFAELRKWADTSSAKYGLLVVRRERRAGRLGNAIKVGRGNCSLINLMVTWNRANALDLRIGAGFE